MRQIPLRVRFIFFVTEFAEIGVFNYTRRNFTSYTVEPFIRTLGRCIKSVRKSRGVRNTEFRLYVK